MTKNFDHKNFDGKFKWFINKAFFHGKTLVDI